MIKTGKVNPDEFVGMLRRHGCRYDPCAGGIVSGNGKPKGKITTNGYKMVMVQEEGKNYYMCEQRAVWWWFHPESDYTLVVDHLNCDRSDNRIENLEAVTMEENVRRIKERGRLHPCRGEKSGKTNLSNREAAAIRYMAQEGYPRKDIARMLVGDKAKNPTVTVNRIIEGTRFADIDPYDLWSVYPIIVAATARTDMPMAEQIKNAAMGLTGECGEVVDHLKKVLYQGHEADRDALIEEIGDVLFYLTWLSVLCLGLDRAEIMLRNADKLYKRYPHGFDADRSRKRED